MLLPPDLDPDPDSKPKIHRSHSISALNDGALWGLGGDEGYRDRRCYDDADGGNNHLPKINFPPFDGCNPKLWLGRCLDYFEMYFMSRAPLDQGIHHAHDWSCGMLAAVHGGAGAIGKLAVVY